MKIPSRLFGNLEKLNYIKCDIEGFEKMVLEDLKGLISHHRPVVQVEIWDEYQPSILAMFDAMQYNTYQLYKGKLAQIKQLPPPDRRRLYLYTPGGYALRTPYFPPTGLERSPEQG